LQIASDSIDCRVYRTSQRRDFVSRKQEIHAKFKLHWQEGYGVLTVRKDELVKVSHYIDRQEEHHRRGNLSDLLERFECEEDDWPEGTMEKAS